MYRGMMGCVRMYVQAVGREDGEGILDWNVVASSRGRTLGVLRVLERGRLFC